MSYNYFYIIYHYALFVLVIFECLKISSKSNIYNNNGQVLSRQMIIITIIVSLLSIWFGSRPGNLTIFGDTPLYMRNYEADNYTFDKDPGFTLFAKTCLALKLPTRWFLSLIAFLYTFFPLFVISRKTRYKYLMLLFIMTSFSYLGYGLNGMRNGLALSIFTLSFLFIKENGSYKFIPIVIISLIASSIHISSLLPAICLFLSLFVVKDFKQALVIWLLSIPMSILAGGPISAYFLNLGFGERLEGYLGGSGISKGFRWDFVLYSIVPIILAYYVTIKKKIKIDYFYNLLINTYTLSNALWILVIRASFSNRFAYLSWFLYPLVIAYPIVTYRIWHNSKQKVAIILFLYYLFTFIMFLKSNT